MGNNLSHGQPRETLCIHQQFCSLMRNLYKSAVDDLTKVWNVRDWRHAAFSQESWPTQPRDIIQEKPIKTEQVIVNLLI